MGTKSRTGTEEHLREIFDLNRGDMDSTLDKMRSIQRVPVSPAPPTPEKIQQVKSTPQSNVDIQHGKSTLKSNTQPQRGVGNQHGNPTPSHHTPASQPNRLNQHPTPTGKSNTLQVFKRPTKGKTPIRTHAQKTIWNYLAQMGNHITTNDEIAQNTGISTGTTRDVLRMLEQGGYIEKDMWRDGFERGLMISIVEDKAQQAAPTPNPNRLNQQGDYLLESNMEESPSLDRKIEGLSIYQRLILLKQDDFDFHYPGLAQIGFGPTQIEQILERLTTVGKSPDRLFEAMEHANWELEDGGIRDKEGKLVENPLGFVFQSLARGGYFRKPKGFISPEEQAAKDARERAEAELKAQEAAETVQYEIWRRSLSAEDIGRLKTEAEKTSKFLGPEDVWMRAVWKKQTKGKG